VRPACSCVSESARYRESAEKTPPNVLDAQRLRRICLDAGADDVGFVSIGRPELDDQRDDILRHFPWTKGLVSIVCRMNREPIRSPARSVSNLEFHHTGDRVNDVARTIVAVLEVDGHRAVNPAMGFPMEMDRFPGKIWVVAHKPVAVAAGLGHMGIHRNVIHPKFGNFILLDTVLVDAEISEEGVQLDYNPCLECKLCVAACPVGAIGPDGYFDFSACATHNYREFMGGFIDWVDCLLNCAHDGVRDRFRASRLHVPRRSQAGQDDPAGSILQSSSRGQPWSRDQERDSACARCVNVCSSPRSG